MPTQTTDSLDAALPQDFLLKARNVVPKRPMFFSEALTATKLQALKVRILLGQRSPRADFGWLRQVPNLTVKQLPAHEVEVLAGAEASGVTKRLENGDYFIAINKNRSYSHQRFTLAHEIKHFLDYPYAQVLYGKLGHGDTVQRDKRVERLCDHFAANLLVPSNLLKRAWSHGIQDLGALAGLFAVSEETMQIRLENEGFIERDPWPNQPLLRRIGVLPELEETACWNAT
jgi:hypothetical protein